MSTVLTIGGAPIILAELNSYPTTLNLRFDAYSSLVVERKGGPLPGLPDPWLGKPVTLAIGGVTYFVGDCSDVEPTFTRDGWVMRYLFRDLKARADRVPMTDANTLTDSAAYNIAPDDPLSIPSREGRTVGQILTDVLTMVRNATDLDSAGIGAYVSLGPPPVLPASTIADLAALTVIPPSGVYVGGEKLLCGIGAFVKFWAPNHTLWVEPDTGAIRILDKRLYVDHTFTIGTDPIEPTPLRRSVGDCYQRVSVRGQPIAEPKMVDTLQGTLEEDFGFGTTSNADAKAAYTPADSLSNVSARSEGTCVCVDTLNITVTPVPGTQHWIADFWDQTITGHLGQIALTFPAATGIGLTVWRRIVANGALIVGGSCNIQVDLPLPATNYTQFSLYGLLSGEDFCYKKYKVVDADVAAAMANQFTYPAVWVGYNGGTAISVSYPIGSVCYSNSGNPPFSEWPLAFTQDPSSAHIYFLQSTYVLCGNHQPSDVRALLAVNTGVNTAVYPPDSGGLPVYAGTSNTIEGLEDTLTVTVGEWRDPINTTAMTEFAHDLVDSVKDSIVEGSVVYHGLYTPALTPGAAVSVTGNGYSTGWEGLALPILEVELTWNCGSQTQYTTTMHCSNRRAHFSAAAFLKPSREAGGQQFLENGWNLFGFGTQQMIAMSQASQANMEAMTTAPDETQSGDPADYGIEGPGKQGQTKKQYEDWVDRMSGDKDISDKDYNKLVGQLEGTDKDAQHSRALQREDERRQGAADRKQAEQLSRDAAAPGDEKDKADKARAYNDRIFKKKQDEEAAREGTLPADMSGSE